MTAALQVIKPGISAITDLGRATGPAIGMPVGGALDQYSAQAANLLVDRRPDSPLIEITALDFAMAPSVAVLVAVTGAPVEVQVDGRAAPMWQPFLVPAGASLTVGAMRLGLRSYLAVAGLEDPPRLLGSVAPDAAAGFGGRLNRGDTLIVDPADRRLKAADRALDARDFAPDLSSVATVAVVDGPDIADFGSTARVLYSGEYRLTPTSNHVGLRMTGPLPERQTHGELISRGVPIGAVEVPPGDELVVLLRARGITAGYPVLAVATPVALDRLGQVRPGQTVRFIRQDAAAASAELRAVAARLGALASMAMDVYGNTPPADSAKGLAHAI